MKIGIDLGGSHIAIGVIDNKDNIIEKVEKRLMAKEKKDIKNLKIVVCLILFGIKNGILLNGYILMNTDKLVMKYRQAYMKR